MEIENIKDILDVQLPIVKMAIKQNDISKIKELGEQEAFKKNAVIQYKMMQFAIEEGDYEKARQIGSKRIFKNNPFIQELLQEIQVDNEEQETIEIEPLQDEEFDEKEIYLNKIKTKLYYNKISQEDIEEIKDNLDISDYEKTCMLIAIFAKSKNIKQAKQVAKAFKNESKNLEHNKTINIVIQKIENQKTKIFDMGIFDSILSWEFDEALQKTYIDEQRQQEAKRKKEMSYIPTNNSGSEPSTDVKAKQDIYESIEYNSYFPNYKERNNQFKRKLKVKSDYEYNTTNQERKIREKNYYEEIKDYLESKRKEIYVNMQSTNYEIQRKAISNWDKMDSLMDKLEHNSDNKEFLNNLHNKVSQLREKENGMIR